MYLRRNIVGRRYGRLTVTMMSKDHLDSRRVLWACKCDCGKTVDRPRSSLRSGSKKVASCGCVRWRGREHDYSKAVITHEYARHVCNAKQRNLTALSRATWEVLVIQPCAYCGQIDNRKTEFGATQINGIDRVDSDKDYGLDNMVPCCGKCNRMKLTSNRHDFLSHVNKILNHLSHA